MLVLTGTLLVLLTWAVGVGVVMTAGLLPALVTSPRPAGRPRSAAAVLRRAMWWGLLVVTVFAYLANLAWPLASPQTAVAALAALAVLGTPGWVLLRRRMRAARAIGAADAPRSVSATFMPGRGRLRRVSTALLAVALGVAIVYLAVAAIGPVTNYDSGLYHLGAIRYAQDFPTVPGLANLYYALAYGNAEFPIAALLGNSPWGADGFRLLNGFVVVLAIVDLALRWPGGQRVRLGSIILDRGTAVRRATPGLFVLLAGLLTALVPLVALSDYWVTSPTQDSFALIVTIVATAYLADTTWGGSTWLADGALVLALSIQLVLLRPTMVAFGIGAFLVLVVLAWRRRTALRGQAGGWVLTTVVVAGLVAAVAATARDYLLSGWLQFPLSVHAFDVPWLAEDPTMDRIATLGYHRDPADLWGATQGWGWVGQWLADRVHQWETYQLAGLAVVALVLAHVADRAVRADRADRADRTASDNRARQADGASRPNARWRAMLLAMLPSLLATVVWFAFSPPSYRFAWGPLFTLATVPIGWSLWLLATRRPSALPPTTIGQRIAPATWQSLTALAVAVPVLLVAGYSALARLDVAAITAEREWRLGVAGLAVPYAVAPVSEVPVVAVPTVSGLVLVQPTETDQCWTTFPLCTPRPNPALHLRGTTLTTGFTR